ncbi:tRNA (cytidine(34)-2'-O)-methyltransferase [BD1-7 clade bacterium]|uniref:tRNA (Cytidine(34)-2'-O)-methyltransferase n=1 Tax=BD1-7 clade bacterium TaxID=2029982 RepID=A0A5S9PTT8_9GAMM|nr:tRNA (cytidine(34)-2'-O)-methyltransferase [BD1-7 clade bacterium]
MSNGFACIGLSNPKNPENVGIILRAAGCYGVNSVFYSGQRYQKAREFMTNTQKVHERIPIIHSQDLRDSVPLGATVVAIELVEGAKPLIEYEHPKNAFYVFGPEDGSLKDDVLAWCDDVVYIPTIGCMNLAATANVVLYDRMAKSGTADYSIERIRESQDTNNNTRV